MSTEDIPDTGHEFEAPDYDNPDAAERARKQYREQQREQREEATKAQQTKAQIEALKASDTVWIEVLDGQEVEFSDLSADTIAEMADLGGEVQQADAEGEDLSGEAAGENVRFVGEVLANHAVDEAFKDPKWWLRTFNAPELYGILDDLGDESTVDEEEVREFRED